MSRDLDQYRDTYFKQYDFEEVQVKYRRRKVLEILGTYRAKRILEVGCGLESICHYYKEFAHIDVVEPVLDFVVANKAKADPAESIKWINLPIEQAAPNLNTGSYDFILVSGLLHELDHPEAVLKSIYPIAGKETTIHFNVPNPLSLHNLLAVKMGLIDSPYQKSKLALELQRRGQFDLEQLEALLEKHGFNAKDKGSLFLKPFSHNQMSFLAKNPEIFPPKLFDAFYEIIQDFPTLGSEIYINAKKNESLSSAK